MLRCMYGNAPEKDCGARACPIHGTASAFPYGPRQGARLSTGKETHYGTAPEADPYDVSADWNERA